MNTTINMSMGDELTMFTQNYQFWSFSSEILNKSVLRMLLSSSLFMIFFFIFYFLTTKKPRDYPPGKT